METGRAERVLSFEQVRDAVAESLGIDESEVSLSSSFVSLGADSMDRVQLILDLEEALGLEIPEDDSRKFVTVEDVLKYVNQR